MNVNVDEIAQKACWAFDHGIADSGELCELFDYLAKEAFPDDPNYISKALAKKSLNDLLLKSAGGHLRNMQMRGGHNEDAIRKLVPRRPVDADKGRRTDEGRSDGATGGKPTSHNNLNAIRTQRTANMNPPSSTPPNGEIEESYDSLNKFKIALADYFTANPDCKSYWAGVAAVGNKDHTKEKAAKAKNLYAKV
jgi:hypothetical protein